MLPPEPEVLEAREAFPDAQELLSARVSTGVVYERQALSWYGSIISDERGSFGVVNPDGPLADLVGDHVRITHREEVVVVYVAAAAEVPTPLAITRRAFLALGRLTEENITVTLEVLL